MGSWRGVLVGSWIGGLSCVVLAGAGCGGDAATSELAPINESAAVEQGPVPVPVAREPQRPGDPLRGRALFLDNGTPDAPYVSCGIPDALVRLLGLEASWASAPKIADRRDAQLPYELGYVTRPSGVRVLTTNCLFCHASRIGDSLVIGLPESNRDFTLGASLTAVPDLEDRVGPWLGLDPDSSFELSRLMRVVVAVSAFPRPDTIGINPADGLFGAMAMHRDPVTLRWNDEPDPAAGPVPTRILFADVPALWNMHRRPRMFHTGFGGGDHARVMMTAALLCLEDSAEAARIDAYFPDVRAYIESLRAPRYEVISGLPIDSDKAAHGREIFVKRCQRCHGGKDGEGPEPLDFVPLGQVGTDPLYAQVTTPGNDLPEGNTINYFFEFFNRSWYGTYGSVGRLTRPTRHGYVPPPLDGVWATAPYFHNGSVPTLEAVLDPRLRPRRFRRSFDPARYDFEKLGWPYIEVLIKGVDRAVYDTTRLGNSNRGHEFAADLPTAARRALLEYLKTF